MYYEDLQCTSETQQQLTFKSLGHNALLGTRETKRYWPEKVKC